jgi:hypothetical protein
VAVASAIDTTIKIISVSVQTVHISAVKNGQRQTKQIVSQNLDSGFQPQQVTWGKLLDLEGGSSIGVYTTYLWLFVSMSL